MVSLTQIAIVFAAGGGAIIASYIQAKMERRWELQKQVHRPLFDEVHRIASDGELPYDRNLGMFQSVWYDFDAFQRRYVKKDIVVGPLVMMDNDLQGLNKLIPLISEGLRKALEETDALEEIDGVDYFPVEYDEEESKLIPIDDWVRLFAPALIYAESKEGLKEELIQLSREYNDWHQHTYLEGWGEEQIYVVWAALRFAESRWGFGKGNSYETYKFIRKQARMAHDDLGSVLNLI